MKLDYIKGLIKRLFDFKTFFKICKEELWDD